MDLIASCASHEVSTGSMNIVLIQILTEAMAKYTTFSAAALVSEMNLSLDRYASKMSEQQDMVSCPTKVLLFRLYVRYGELGFREPSVILKSRKEIVRVKEKAQIKEKKQVVEKVQVQKKAPNTCRALIVYKRHWWEHRS